MKKVLVVEDNRDIALTLKKRFEVAGFDVGLVANGWDMARQIMGASEPPEALVLDMMLPGKSGYDLLGTVKARWPKTRIFVFTAQEHYEKTLPKDQIDGFFLKTGGIDKLVAAVNESLAA